MLKRLTFGFLLLAAGALAQAEEIKAKVKSVDAEKGMITVTVGEADRTLEVSKDAKVTHRVGKNEKKDDKETVTEVKVDGLAPKKK